MNQQSTLATVHNSNGDAFKALVTFDLFEGMLTVTEVLTSNVALLDDPEWDIKVGLSDQFGVSFGNIDFEGELFRKETAILKLK